MTLNANDTLGQMDKDSRLGRLDIDRTAKGNTVHHAAQRAIKGLSLIRENQDTQTPFHVMEEPNGQGSIISEGNDGTMLTFATYGWAEAAKNAIERKAPDFQAKLDKHNRQLETQTLVKNAFSR